MIDGHENSYREFKGYRTITNNFYAEDGKIVARTLHQRKSKAENFNIKVIHYEYEEDICVKRIEEKYDGEKNKLSDLSVYFNPETGIEERRVQLIFDGKGAVIGVIDSQEKNEERALLEKFTMPTEEEVYFEELLEYTR